MEKRTLVAIVLFLVLGIGAIAVMRAPDKGERHGPPPRPFPALKAADITGLEITNQQGEKTTLAKNDGVWRVTAPGDWRADANTVKAIVDGVDKISFGDIVTENAGKHADLGVGDQGATRLKIIAAAQSPEIILGSKPVSGFTMLRVAGKNEVWQASGLVSYQVNKSTKDLRDHAVVPLLANDVDKLAVEVPGGSRIVVERDKAAPAADNKAAPHWKIVESTGDGPKVGEAFDESEPQTILMALQSLRANDFADSKSAKDAGLEPPQLVITATVAGNEHALEIGAAQGDQLFVRAKGEAQIDLAKKYSLERAMARPVDFHDKTLAKVKGDELTEVRVVQGKDTTDLVKKDGKWTLAGAPVEENKAKALANGFEALYGTSFVTDKTVKTELDKPRAVITLTPKTGAKTIIKVGGTNADGDYYVSVDGKKDVLVGKKFAIDRLLKKPSDLQAAPAKKK